LNLGNDCVHAVNWWTTLANSLREQLGASDGTRNNVADEGVSLRQVSGKVHLLPFVLFLDSEAWKTEIRSNSVRSHEVDLSIYR